MRSEKIENLSEFNKNKFSELENWLENFYSDYPNKNNIIRLLEYWTFGLRAIFDLYGIEGVIYYCRAETTSCPLRFSWLYEYNFNIGITRKKTKRKYLFLILGSLINHYTVPGVPIKSIFDKIRWRLSRVVIDSFPIIESAYRKDKIINKLVKIFGNCDYEIIYKALDTGLPRLFYSNLLNVPKVKVHCTTLEGALTDLMEFNGDENILLLNKYIRLIGRQHGGGYGSYVGDYARVLEESLADKFIGWGLMEHNELQHRYVKRSSKDDVESQRFIWVERSRMPNLYKYMYPAGCYQVKNESTTSCIHRALLQEKIEYLNMAYVGKARSEQYENYRVSLLPSSGRGELSLTNGDVLIFDIFNSSLLYYCMLNRDIFICVTSHEDVSLFTKNNRRWFDILYKYGFAFYDDEESSIVDRLREIKSNKPRVPEELIEYYRNVFFLI